jgi:hypothetical protein
MRLGMKAGREIFEARYRRYQRAGKQDKGNILDEPARTTGLNRDHLARVLTSYGKKRRAKGESGHRGSAAGDLPGIRTRRLWP